LAVEISTTPGSSMLPAAFSTKSDSPVMADRFADARHRNQSC
jgi:hypothetical protein